ncbi:MAG TPA: SURF1 family protein [Candidatus Accumulibacter sp.]|nr:SURF1 family protein [Accumulibacter sp.]
MLWPMQWRFHPTVGGTVFALVVLAVLTGLGTWQMKRLAWKESLLTAIDMRLKIAPTPLPAELSDDGAWEYRRVTLTGVYLHDHEFKVGPRTHNGQAGYHLITPLRRAAGGIVMIDRGWIDDAHLSQAERPAGLIQIEGVVTFPKPSRFTPMNDAGKNAWYWTDAPAMARAADLGNAPPFVVTIASARAGVYPVGGKVELNIRNDHRAYMYFWYAMAALSQIIFILAACRKKES